MEHYVSDFTRQLKEAINIGLKSTLIDCDKNIQNVVITGLGGSGISGKIVSQLVADSAKLPIYINNNYSLPGFVNQNTLVIISSYSGNTEETISAMKIAIDKGAEVACITSGGAILDLAKKHQLNTIVIPGGHPPRTALAYSFTQQFFLLKHYGIISFDFKSHLSDAVILLDKELENIKEIAKNLANKLFQKTAVIYSDASYEGAAIRMRQQLNENAKVLCWHHVLPEMNHNELVGWAGGDSNKAVIFLRNESDYQRTQVRMKLSKEIISKHTSNISDVYSMGNSAIAKTLYLVNLGDWVSVYLAKLYQVDPIEVNVIGHLKSELGKVS
ncbi:MAG: glucose/mannose-6-phosphate isomerase [Flavobacteriales bacterium]|jgi:glucose/mannose-6-phosphate isomerase